MPLKTYDESLNFLRTALDRAELGTSGDRANGKEKLEGFRRLERFVRTVEQQLKPEADFDAVIAHENAISSTLDGRSVFDDKRARAWKRPVEDKRGRRLHGTFRQRSLFK